MTISAFFQVNVFMEEVGSNAVQIPESQNRLNLMLLMFFLTFQGNWFLDLVLKFHSLKTMTMHIIQDHSFSHLKRMLL